jgi:hypothetical protein
MRWIAPRRMSLCPLATRDRNDGRIELISISYVSVVKKG